MGLGNRRVFLKQSSLILYAAAAGPVPLLGDEQKPLLRAGLITDLHYADKAPSGTRHYRETLAKLEEAADRFASEGLSLLIELGDLIDAADSVQTELGYLKTINQKYSAICSDRHYVLGNHCVDTLKKEEFLGEIGQKDSYYSFDHTGFHFVILDSCFRSDGTAYQRRNFQWTDANIPASELEWLRADLAATGLPTIVLAHQRLDVSTNHGVRNGDAVRRILEESGRVLAVFQGHSHQNDLKQINGIHYCTLAAMVEGAGEENNGYSVLDLFANGTIRVNGFRRQEGYLWERLA